MDDKTTEGTTSYQTFQEMPRELSTDFREKLNRFEKLSINQQATDNWSTTHQIRKPTPLPPPSSTQQVMKHGMVGRRIHSLMTPSISSNQEQTNPMVWPLSKYSEKTVEETYRPSTSLSSSSSSATTSEDHTEESEHEDIEAFGSKSTTTSSGSDHEMIVQPMEKEGSPHSYPNDTITSSKLKTATTTNRVLDHERLVLPPLKPPRMINRRTMSEQFTGREKSSSQPISDQSPIIQPVGMMASSVPSTREETIPITASPRKIYPETLNANRRPPILSGRVEIKNKMPTSCVFLSKNYVCIGGNELKIWSIATGELSRTVLFPENVKVLSGSFISSETNNPRDRDLWVGLSDGRICLINTHLGRILDERSGIHSFGVGFMITYQHGIISISWDGHVNVWPMGNDGSPPSLRIQPRSFVLVQRPSMVMMTRSTLWTCSPKGLNAYEVSSGTQIASIMTEMGTASIIGFTILRHPNYEYIVVLHMDRTVTVYDASNFEKKAIVHASEERIGCIQSVGEQYVWLGLATGEILVLDAQDNWCVTKQWRAHQTPILSLNLSCETSLLILASISTHGTVRLWNGSLGRDYIEKEVRKRESEYGIYQDLTIFIGTWNVNGQSPHLIPDDAIRSWFTFKDSPDLIVIGLQEIVNLESKKITAKSIFRSSDDPGAMNSRGWQQKFTSILRSLGGTSGSGYGSSSSSGHHTPPHYQVESSSYELVQSNYLVGLFISIYIRAPLRKHLQHVDMAMVKTGLHGLHGNKGGIAMRVTIDDSSICFVNAHLAAGQSQIIARNADVASVLTSASLRHPVTSIEGVTFINGGDGTMIQDHEFCVFFGDLNYRIDMSSHGIRRKIDERDYNGLYLHDQLRCTKPRMWLRNFREGPLHFAPTYKFDVGTDTYDTSDKMRSPAWCDRILWRGESGKVILHTYQRHELRYSDHRPVSCLLTFRIKKINHTRWSAIRTEISQLWEGYERARIERMKQW